TQRALCELVRGRGLPLAGAAVDVLRRLRSRFVDGGDCERLALLLVGEYLARTGEHLTPSGWRREPAPAAVFVAGNDARRGVDLARYERQGRRAEESFFAS